MEANAGDDGRSWLANNDAGSGPYTLERYRPNQEAVFTRYPDYWGGPTGRRTVVFRYCRRRPPNRKLRNGEIDIAMDTPDGLAESRTTRTSWSTGRHWCSCRVLQDGGLPTANRKLREAIVHTYNYTSTSKTSYGAGTLAAGPLPAAMPCHDPSVYQPTYDLRRPGRRWPSRG